ncbi:hypothetical protein Tco_0026883 [Tanacetum coccineum]
MVESERMSYIRREQKDLRSETYSNLAKLAADPDSGVTIRAEKGLKSNDRPDLFTQSSSKKRGLPHAHILLFLEPEDKLTTAAHIDKYISAEIPDKDEDPELYQIVTDHMMHGPCGAERPSCPCTYKMKAIFGYEKESKSQPKENKTRPNENCAAITRYLLACEAAWRIYGFDIHYRFPPVETLPFHLPNEQSVIFNEHDSLDYTLDKASVNETKFQAWMETNKTDTFAQKLLYVEFSKYYVWKHDEMVWQRRQKGESIGCIHHVPPSWGDMFYFRVLLNKVRGTTDWEDFKKFDDVVYPTFKHACYARGLLEDDNEYIDGLLEASH